MTTYKFPEDRVEQCAPCGRGDHRYCHDSYSRYRPCGCTETHDRFSTGK